MNIFTTMENTPFQAVIFKEKMPLLETELNELQMLAFTRQREIFRYFLGDNACLGYKGEQSSFTNGTLVLNGLFLLDGILIKCENARAGGLSWGDNIYLSFDIKEADSETILHEHGYEYGVQIENTIKDNRFPICTTGRMYLSFILGNVPVPGASYCKNIGTIEEGKFICTLPGGIPFILEKITKDISDLQKTMKEDIISKLESLDAESVGALPADGTALGSYSIVNMFDEQPTSLNVNMLDPSIINRITYFMATSSTTEGKPPIDCMIINLSWYSGYGGTQLGVGMYSGPRMFIRAFNNGSGGWDNKWLEFLTTGNISDNGYIDNSNPPELPVDFRLPYAGTPYQGNIDSIYPDLHHFVKKHKSGFYTVLFGDTWYNIFSLRHRNGYSDGAYYGLLIYSKMTQLDADLYWAQQAGDGKNGASKVILDSKNYASRIFPITHGNEVNYVYNMDSRSSDYMWINYRDAKEAGASKPITEYYFGNGSGTASYAGIRASYLMCANVNKTAMTTNVVTSTYIKGARGETVAINMIAEAGFNMIARVKSTNGQFIFGCYNRDFQLYYISDDIVNASTNSYTNGITLMNENGHMIPLNNNSHDIGTSTYRYRYLHVVTIYTSRLNSIYSSNTSIYLGSNVSISSDTDIMINSSTGRTGINNAVTLTCVNSNNIRIGVRHKAYSSSTLTYFESDRDNMTVLGGASTRWKQIYAVTSSITTSDRREKKNISYMGSYSNEDTYMSDDTLQSFIRGLLPCIYLRIDGDTGRPHHGLISQDVEELLKKLGIKDHAGFIKSPKTETIEIEEEVEEEYVDEADGQTKTRTVIHKSEEQREIPGKYIYGLRYEEFIADIVRFVQIQDERIEKQQEVINKQQETIKAQDAKIQELEKRFEAFENLLKERGIV